MAGLDGHTLPAVELHYAQVPGYAVPTLSKLEPFHERAFELLGFQPHPAPHPGAGSAAREPESRGRSGGRDAKLVTNGLFGMGQIEHSGARIRA